MSRSRNFLLTIILLVLPILVLSGFAFSAYLSRPPELPNQDEVIASEIPEETNRSEEAEEATEETTEETTEESTEQAEQEPPARPAKVDKDNFYTFLVTGTDHEGNHTDTILLVSLDTAAMKVNVVSVPRDTQVDVPREHKKLNAAYAYGGTKELKRELESILGFVPHYYIRVDLEAFSKVVDAVGGVEFDVPQDMDYDDPGQDLYIHLVKGQQILDGDKALQLVRFRGYVNADLGRMQIQQQFLKALAKKILSPSNIIKLNTFIDIFQQDIKTDISLRDLQWFAQQIIKINPESDINMQTLPHSDEGGNYLGVNYLFLLPEEVVKMVNRTVNPYTTDITLEDVNIIKLIDLTEEERRLLYQKAFEQAVEQSSSIGWKVFGLSSISYSPIYWDQLWKYVYGAKSKKLL